jgi:hypothetical protein
MTDFQVVASFCISLLGAMLMVTAYFELEDGDFELEEVEDDERSRP